ncbi:MAG: hypothetical protein B6U95_02860 [Thermofilum sp. ex4484_82]|nr:MAG: hypothetical protein B6U95_02860 [Thermofilum sp. ex4484_82]OYT39077.1 MAG: hypothetical protein B6U96_02855 [Archaeoglobales archaeon ex4484_92]
MHLINKIEPYYTNFTLTKSKAEIIECEDCIATPGVAITPGFIDIHMHGHGGVDVNFISSEKDLVKLSTMFSEHSVTTFLPTTVSFPIDKLAEIAELAYYASISENKRADIAGVYFEGPYFIIENLE